MTTGADRNPQQKEVLVINPNRAPSSTRNDTAPAALPDKLLAVKDLAVFTGMSTRWIHERTRLGEIPCYRFGTQLRFDPEEVRTWLARYHQAGDERNGGR